MFLARSTVGGGLPYASCACVVLTLGMVFFSMGAAEAEQAREHEFNVPRQNVEAALNELATQASALLLFPYDLVQPVDSNPVTGKYTVRDALGILLRDTGLTGGLTEGGVITISRAVAIDSQGETRMSSQDGKKSRIKRKGLLGVLAAVFSVGAEAQEAVGTDEDEQELEEIVVTGTNIRGISPDSSPSFVFYKEDIAKTGFGTISEFVQSLPQNFGGGSNADVPFLPNDRAAVFNQAGGASVNLRGLGSGSTLVLLNGSRLAPAGIIGDFVDISMIPLSAVERVEVLTDGASAIYGADAIAGVINFVLRDDYDGAETFVRFGSVTEGDLNEYRVGQTFGKNWDTGNALVSYEFYRRDNLGVQDRDFSSASALPTDLLPEQESHNVLLTASQQLNDRVTLRGHGTYSQRDMSRVTNQFGTFFNDSRTKQYGASAGAETGLWGDWLLDVSGGYYEVTEFIERTGSRQGEFQNDSDLWSLDGKVDGSLFHLPGGGVKIATGLSYREETFSFVQLHLDRIDRKGDRNAFGAFGEAFIPIVGAENRAPGVERLELTLAGRYDDYSDFGDSFNPKAGILWSPAEGLNFRSSYGTSFNPPNLGDSGDQRGVVQAFFAPDPASATGESLTIFNGLANPDLGPEESTAWTAGFDYSHDVGPGGFDLSITWFNISYTDRIGSPGTPFFFLNDPLVFADVIIVDPDSALTEALIADASIFFNFSGGAWAMPGDEDFILDGRVLNLARADTSGLDFDLSYNFDTDIGQLDFGVNGSYLLKQEKQITASAPVFDVVSTVFNPVDLRLRGSAFWSRNGWVASIFVNYLDSYVDDRNLLGTGDVAVDSWTTVDFYLSYDAGEGSGSTLTDNTRFSFGALNVFNQDPPRIQDGLSASTPIGFDPTNADPLGRFVSFQVTKKW